MILVSLLCVFIAFICKLAPWFFCLSWLITWMMFVSLCIHCWCGRFCCWWHGSQSVDLHPLVMLIHIYQRSPFCILLCLYAPALYCHGGLQIYHVTYYALDMRIYNSVLIRYLNIYIYNLSNIACLYHNFVWEIDHACISCVSGILGSAPG